MNEVWHLEGYIASGNTSSVGNLTRIHGTVKFTADQIQFSTNIGNFTRQATLAGMNYNNQRKEETSFYDDSVDPPVEVKTEHIVENTRAQLTSVDQSTLVLNYGNTNYPLQDLSENLFTSYEWIGAVLTRRAVSSRLFPFDEQSVELWLQPDLYEGPSFVFKSNHIDQSIDASTQSDQMTIGGSPMGGFFIDLEGEKVQLQTSAKLNEFHDNFLEQIRTLVKTDYYNNDSVGPVPKSGANVSKSESYQMIDWGATRYIHLGDCRIFWFSVDARIGETISTDLKSGIFWNSGPYIFGSEMECGVLEQKLWFESSSSTQAAQVASAILKNNTKNIAESVEEKRAGVAIVKLLRGEVYQLYLSGRRLLKVGDWVRVGDVVQTSEKSFVKLVFLDKSQMNVGPESEMKIETFSGKESGIIDIIKGKIRSQVTKDYLRMRDEDKAKLFHKTKNAVTGVRGTEFDISYGEENGIGTTELLMLEGAVEFNNLTTGVTTLVSHQDSIVAQGPTNGSAITGPEINVLGRTLQSFTSGVSVQSLGAVAPSASSEPVVFRIRNVGQTPLTGVKPQIRGLHAADFSIVQLPEETLSPITGEGTLHVVFTPSTLGTRQAVLEIASSDPDESPFLINLEGAGQIPTPLSITTHPLSSSIDYNSAATLQVAASGQGIIDYQWYQGAAGNIAMPVGTNAASFTTPTLTQTTSYWVRVSNSEGSVDSNIATVTVGSPPSPPTITTHPPSTSIAYNSTATLQVAASGQGTLSYQWYQGSAGNTATPVGTNAASFTTPALTQTTSYWVRVSNAAGSVDSNIATVTVGSPPSPPTITTHPPSTSIAYNSTATLQVAASGQGTLSYQWYQGSAGNTATPVGTNAASFTTPALTQTTSYWVRVSNAAGSVDSNIATVNAFGLDITDFQVGNRISRDFSALIAPGNNLKIEGKLPPGVTFNAKTGLLQGELTKEGSFQAFLRVMNGKIVKLEIPLKMVVAPFPQSLIGGYEAILEDAQGEPVGALNLIVGKNVWSASLLQRGQKSLTAKGKFTLDTGSPSATLSLPFKGLPVMELRLNGNDPRINATWSDGRTLSGFKLASLQECSSVASNIGIVLDAGESNDVELPAGYGWASGSVSKVGKIAFKGAMSDGTAISFSLSLSTTGQAILWVQPYKNLNSYLAGVVDLLGVGRPANSSLAINRSCRWVLHAGEKGNPYAFPSGVAIEAQVAEIGAPAAGSQLAIQLQGPPSEVGWPSQFTVDPKFNLIAVGSSVVKWKGKAASQTGVFSGTYVLPAGFSSEVLGTSARASGIFLKEADGDRYIGYGLIWIPSSPKGSFRTMGITIEGM